MNFTIRPWYEDVINNPNSIILTSVHSDLLTNKTTTTLIAKIKDNTLILDLNL